MLLKTNKQLPKSNCLFVLIKSILTKQYNQILPYSHLIVPPPYPDQYSLLLTLPAPTLNCLSLSRLLFLLKSNRLGYVIFNP